MPRAWPAQNESRAKDGTESAPLGSFGLATREESPLRTSVQDLILLHIAAEGGVEMPAADSESAAEEHEAA